MSNQRRSILRARWGLLAAAVLFATGCSVFAPPYQLAEGGPKSGDLQRLLLLPMNYDYSPSPSLAPGTERMGERLRSFLESNGYEVVEPRMSSTLELWQDCAARAGGIAVQGGEKLDVGRYEAARSDLVRRTLEAMPADGVVASTVMVRKGRYVGKNLRWDGVTRPVPIDMRNTNIPLVFVEGSDFGTSLRTSVFDRSGNKVFERYVGLEPIREYKALPTRMELFHREDLFQDEVLLEEAVEQSFQPWLVRASDAAE